MVVASAITFLRSVDKKIRKDACEGASRDELTSLQLEYADAPGLRYAGRFRSRHAAGRQSGPQGDPGLESSGAGRQAVAATAMTTATERG